MSENLKENIYVQLKLRSRKKKSNQNKYAREIMVAAVYLIMEKSYSKREAANRQMCLRRL